jgi:YjbE family integral membrane protein
MLADIAALVEVILIDLALSADNAVAVGLAASALDHTQRRRAVMWGVLLALILRIVFGLLTVELLQVRGLLLAGGLVLFWVAWRMWQDLRKGEAADQASNLERKAPVSFGRALVSIVVANLALSLDNVLAVAGVARHTPAIMTFGLILSVVLMGVAANFIAGIIERHRWIGYAGVIVIVIAGAAMIWEDGNAFLPAYIPAPPGWLGGDTV